MSRKQRIFELIDANRAKENSWAQWIDFLIMSLIVLSVLGIILESFAGVQQQLGGVLRGFEIFTILVFTLEYLLRIWTADLKFPHLSPHLARIKFVTSTIGLIDLIAILPFYLPFFLKFDLRFIRLLRIVRLLRIFKLNRYTSALNMVARVFYEKRIELGITFMVTCILLLLSSALMYNLENESQPEAFPNIIATFWWAIATLTTVGYGDVYPITGMGKFMGGIIALLGVGLVALPTGIISAGFIEKVEGKESPDRGPESSEQVRYCPYCGERLPH
ncbi:MAG: ion transporter [Bacteroidota bacterium]